MSSINFDLRKIRAIAFDVDGVLSPSTIPMAESGEPLRMVNVKDGYALQLAMKMGYIIAIISGARTEAVKVRFHGLGIADVYTGVSIKLPCLLKWMDKHSLKPDEVAFVGDDIPDLEVMRHVGLPVAPADAAPEVKEVAKYISPVAGGYGCGRDVIEQIMKAQGTWLADRRAFGW
ncbi:MAG: KdsC family phosphatase [Muribaculaceae bacterium]